MLKKSLTILILKYYGKATTYELVAIAHAYGRPHTFAETVTTDRQLNIIGWDAIKCLPSS